MSKHSYSPETAEKILNRIMDGEMLTKICAEDDTPTRREFYGWMANRPDLKDAYARATETAMNVTAAKRQNKLFTSSIGFLPVLPARPKRTSPSKVPVGHQMIALDDCRQYIHYSDS